MLWAIPDVSSFAAFSILCGCHYWKRESRDGERGRQEPCGLRPAFSPTTSQSSRDGRSPLLPQETSLVCGDLLPGDGAHTANHWARSGHTQKAQNLYGLQMRKPEMFLLTAWDLESLLQTEHTWADFCEKHQYPLPQRTSSTKSQISAPGHKEILLLLKAKWPFPCRLYAMSISWTSLFEIGLIYTFSKNIWPEADVSHRNFHPEWVKLGRTISNWK